MANTIRFVKSRDGPDPQIWNAMCDADGGREGLNRGTGRSSVPVVPPVPGVSAALPAVAVATPCRGGGFPGPTSAVTEDAVASTPAGPSRIPGRTSRGCALGMQRADHLRTPWTTVLLFMAEEPVAIADAGRAPRCHRGVVASDEWGFVDGQLGLTEHVLAETVDRNGRQSLC
jgi:hypothetical protein